LQTAKYTLLITGFLLALTGCGHKQEIPSAAESMSKNKLVRILTDAVNAPFEFGLDTSVQGLDVDIGNEIGKTLNIEVKWVKASGYAHLFDLLGSGQAEILISAIAIDPQRGEEFAFSKPYFDSGDTIAVTRDNFTIKDLASLSGKKVGVVTGRPGDRFMATQKTAKDVSIVKEVTTDDALGALNRAEIDAVVGDEPILAYSSYKNYPNTTTLPIQVDKYQYGVVVRKGETELLAKINETLDRLRSSGELDSLKAKWFQDVQKKIKERRENDLQQEALKKAPKTINVNITKVSGGFSMDRLDGFVLVLEGASGKYQSAPILTNGNKGNCRFTQPVPPGEYRLNMSILKMTTTLTVPDLPKNTLTMDMNIREGRDIAITIK
jgi:ABC-type amino acid transport substrate-binding protein